MFNSIRHAKQAFMEELLRVPATITTEKGTMTVPMRYARKSANDYTEEQAQQVYPVISVYDHEVRPSEDWSLTGHKYVKNYREDEGKATTYFEPSYMQYRFDVSIACKEPLQYWALEDYMHKRFIGTDKLLLDRELILGYEVAIPVLIETTPQFIPRQDGVHECNYEIVFNAFTRGKEPEDTDTIMDVIIKLFSKHPEATQFSFVGQSEISI